MAGGFNKGKQTDNNPGKNKPDSMKQEMMSPNSRGGGGGGGNTGSSNDKGKSNERSLHSGSKSHQHHQQQQQHQQHSNSQGGGGGGGNNQDGGKGDVSGLSAASAAALSTRDEKKFTGRCRLFVGNLTPDITEEDFRKLFQPYGEISEVYVNASKGFGFIRLDYRHNAEAAKAALDGMQRKGRTLRVRYASLGSALKVKNLSQHVSNELLHQAFSQFGEVERAVVIVDDRGRPTGEGIVEFARKPGAQAAYKRITEGVFLLSSAPRPVTVEPLDQKDEEDGYPEKFINKTDAYKKDRESEPRFAPPGSFEYEFGLRWKELEELEKQQHEGVKKAMEESRLKLEDEMENAMFEQQAEMIRQDLLRQQEELRRLEEIRQQEQIRRRQELEMRRQDEERRRQEDDRRRTDLLLRSQEIRRRQMGQESMGRDRPGDMMGRQGGSPAMNDNQQRGRNTNTGAPPLPPPPPPPAAMGLDRPGQNQMTGGGSMSGGYNYSNQGPMGGQNMGGGPGGSGNTSNSNMGGGPTGGGMTANSMVKMNQSVPNRMRQSRYDQPGDNNFGGTDNYGSAGMGSSAASAMGGGGGPPISSGQMGGGPNGPPSLFNSNMGGNMPGAGNSGMRGGGGGGGGGGGSGGGSGGAGGGSSGSGNSADRGNMMDRRRENANREDYAEMKRMRRY